MPLCRRLQFILPTTSFLYEKPDQRSTVFVNNFAKNRRLPHITVRPCGEQLDDFDSYSLSFGVACIALSVDRIRRGIQSHHPHSSAANT